MVLYCTSKKTKEPLQFRFWEKEMRRREKLGTADMEIQKRVKTTTDVENPLGKNSKINMFSWDLETVDSWQFTRG